MNTFNPDSYCGIYCGACSVYRYGQTGNPDGFAACLKSLPAAEITCDGCKSDNRYAGCRMCKFRDCASSKGVSHCVACPEYPCNIYRQWQSAARFLPHVSEAGPSLSTISRDGFDSWLEGQKERWSCPDCGTPFSWYAVVCPSCGRSLAGKTYRMAGWRKLLCRIILPIVFRKGKNA